MKILSNCSKLHQNCIKLYQIVPNGIKIAANVSNYIKLHQHCIQLHQHCINIASNCLHAGCLGDILSPRQLASYGKGNKGGWGLHDERSKPATGEESPLPKP